MRSFVDMNLYVVRLYPVAACSLIALHYAVFIAYFLSLKYRNIVFVWISRKRRCKHSLTFDRPRTYCSDVFARVS